MLALEPLHVYKIVKHVVMYCVFRLTHTPLYIALNNDCNYFGFASMIIAHASFLWTAYPLNYLTHIV